MNSDAIFHSMTTDRAQPLSMALTIAILPIALLTAAMIGLGFLVTRVIPVAVAISRVYRGTHNPSDVTASFIAGWGCLWILQRAMLGPAALGTSHES